MPEETRYKLISQDQIEALVSRAHSLPRCRVNWNLHGSLEDPLHRFLNVMLRGTYVAPHRHITPPKPESFVVLEGEVALVQFSEGGEVEVVTRLGPATAPRVFGIDLEAGVWHTLVVLSPVAVIFEVKPGPYVPASDKDFAPWAPREGDPGVPEYLAGLEVRAGLGRASQ